MIIRTGMARYWEKIAFILIILSCLLLTAGCVTTNRTTGSNVTGRVMNEIGQPAVNVNVTLWLDGKIVDIPHNPQRTETGWNGDAFQPYDAGSFVFEARPDRDYKITCEKDDYYGETIWEPGNPIQAHIIIRNPGMNASDTKLKYDNVSDSQVEEAKSIAFNNESVRRMLDGINYSIESIATASDEIDPLVFRMSIIIGNYSNDIEITSQLLVCVDLSHKRVVTIQHSYGGSGMSKYDTSEILPGGYVYSKIVVGDVNGSLQEHMLTLSFTCMNGLTVKPVILDAVNFEKFSDGKPYDIYLFGNQTISFDWSKSLMIPSNQEYYFVITNEQTDQTAIIKSKIGLTV